MINTIYLYFSMLEAHVLDVVSSILLFLPFGLAHLYQIFVLCYFLGLAELRLDEYYVSTMYKKGYFLYYYKGLRGMLYNPLRRGYKLMKKEINWFSFSNRTVFVLGPIFTIFYLFFYWQQPSFMMWLDILGNNILLTHAICAFLASFYNICVISSYASKMKTRYRFKLAVKNAKRMAFYDLGSLLVGSIVCLYAWSFDAKEIINAQFYESYFWLFIPGFISILENTLNILIQNPHRKPLKNRTFTELEAHYVTEYSESKTVFFAIGEYFTILYVSCLVTIYFLGGWHPLAEPFSFIPGIFWFIIKSFFVMSFLIFMRLGLIRMEYRLLLTRGLNTLLLSSIFFVVASLIYYWVFLVGIPIFLCFILRFSFLILILRLSQSVGMLSWQCELALRLIFVLVICKIIIILFL